MQSNKNVNIARLLRKVKKREKYPENYTIKLNIKVCTVVIMLPKKNLNTKAVKNFIPSEEKVKKSSSK